MWGNAWAWKEPWQDGCWAELGGRDWLHKAWAGTWCDRNWMAGSAAPQRDDRPWFSAPAPALLGFDETILGYCSHQVRTAPAHLIPSHRAGRLAARATREIMR
jgi:hypothetical protein